MAPDQPGTAAKQSLAFIGFGEAASAFVTGWNAPAAYEIKAYDIKTDSSDEAVRRAKQDDYIKASVLGCPDLAEALDGAGVVFSTVTADQALIAAKEAATVIGPNTLYLDCNSCAPDTKRRAADLIDGAGARYVDVAVMAPVHPALHKVPLLTSGPHADEAEAVFGRLDMKATISSDRVGVSSSIKMIRSIMIKGLEALVVECVLSGRKAGVDETVLESLDKTFPGFDWKKRAAYMLERVATHGVRRAAEMREVTLSVEQLGLPGDMSRACVDWQQRIGDLGITLNDPDYGPCADALLTALEGDRRAL